MGRDAQLSRIEALLTEERAVLLSGKLTALPDLAADRDRLLAEIAQGTGDRARLQRLRTLALRNTELARAARDGVQAAIARLSAIRAAAGPIGSYSADGARVHIGADRPAFERKA